MAFLVLAQAEGSPKELDLRGLVCPLPALKLRHALKPARPGQVLRVVCTDPMSVVDIPNVVAQTADILVEQLSADGEHVFLVVKA